MDSTADGEKMARTIDDVREAACRYASAQFPRALAVLLTGSWARGEAHADSDLDLVIIDGTVERVMFEGVLHEGWVIDACAVNPSHAEAFFSDSARYRSAPIPHQIADSILVTGDPSLAEHIRRLAIDAIERGPEPISDADRLDMRFDLTLLLHDLMHATETTLPALAAYAHVQLSRAMLDARRRWRAERKSLRQAVAELDPEFARLLDAALVDAAAGDPASMIEACANVLGTLGGPLRTYERFSA